jgi:hypothetical protein
VQDKNQSIIYSILKINKGSNAENFGLIGATFGARRYRVKQNTGLNP